MVNRVNTLDTHLRLGVVIARSMAVMTDGFVSIRIPRLQ